MWTRGEEGNQKGDVNFVFLHLVDQPHELRVVQSTRNDAVLRLGSAGRNSIAASHEDRRGEPRGKPETGSSREREPRGREKGRKFKRKTK